MNKKEELLKLRKETIEKANKIFSFQIKKQLQYEETKVVPIVLDDKVDQFIKWYSEHVVGENYSYIAEYYKPKKLRDFIEKMAAWYELRYPKDRVYKLIDCVDPKQSYKNDENFTIVSETLDFSADLEWNVFDHIDLFIQSLTYEERDFLSNPKYHDQIGIAINGRQHHFFLTSNGYLRTFNRSSKICVHDKDGHCFDFDDVNVEEFLFFLKTGNFALFATDIKNIEAEIERYKNDCYVKEELLNCVMYRIIERGGNRVGPRRALLFAKEFEKNIDIPMTYGVDSTDPGLRLFMNEYIKAGGSKNLVCYINYLPRFSKYEKLNTVTIEKLLKTTGNDAVTFYTPEEDELHQRLIYALSYRINESEKSANSTNTSEKLLNKKMLKHNR